MVFRSKRLIALDFSLLSAQKCCDFPRCCIGRSSLSSYAVTRSAYFSVCLPSAHALNSPRMTTMAKGEAHSTGEALEVEKNRKRSFSPTPEKHIVVGCGAVSVDYLASVARFPQPDEKLRSIDSKVRGGGNCGNALTAAARLGLTPRVLSKVADDAFGKLILDELEGDGVDTSFIVISEIGTSSFTYVIVDKEKGTRTCINSPAYPPMDPKELSTDAVKSILDGGKILYLDGRLPDIALILAKEAKQQGIPILIDAERKREGLDDLLVLADYVVCSSKFPQAWTEAQTLPDALIEMAFRLPDLKFVVVTLGDLGCLMLERSVTGTSNLDITDANVVYESLLKERDRREDVNPFVITSEMGLFRQNSSKGGLIELSGRLLVGTAETIPPSELVDTTGSGDAFIGTVLYALCTGTPFERMLTLGAIVAGANCRALGARAGLPLLDDPKLMPFLEPSFGKLSYTS